VRVVFGVENKPFSLGASTTKKVLEEVHNLCPILEKANRWIWIEDLSHGYSISSTYRIIRGGRGEDWFGMFNLFRRIKALSSAQLTAWRVLGNKIATKVNLLRRGVAVRNSLCSFCREKEEEFFHLFFDCRISWLTWNLCYAWLGITTFVPFHAFSHVFQFRLCNALESVNLGLGNIWIAMVNEI